MTTNTENKKRAQAEDVEDLLPFTTPDSLREELEARKDKPIVFVIPIGGDDDESE